MVRKLVLVLVLPLILRLELHALGELHLAVQSMHVLHLSRLCCGRDSRSSSGRSRCDGREHGEEGEQG